MMNVIPTNTTAEELKSQLEAQHGRPVYLITGEKSYDDGLYRCVDAPGEYKKLTVSGLFFSRFGNQRCIGKTGNGERLFDLEEADLQFHIPLKEGENPHYRENWFESIGLTASLNPIKSFFWVKDPDFPNDLRPFVRELLGYDRVRRPGVQFLVSDVVRTPKVNAAKWQLLEDVKGKYRPLRAPGWYRSDTDNLMGLAATNRMARVDCDPGPCVVCGGAKNERAHIATLVDGPSTWPSGHVCRACAADTFDQWLNLLT